MEREEILPAGFLDHGQMETLREGLRSGRPFGEDAFIEQLEAKLGRPLRLQKTGCPVKAKSLHEPRKVGMGSEDEDGELESCRVAKAPML